jgi:hypothetical protein
MRENTITVSEKPSGSSDELNPIGPVSPAQRERFVNCSIEERRSGSLRDRISNAVIQRVGHGRPVWGGARFPLSYPNPHPDNLGISIWEAAPLTPTNISKSAAALDCAQPAIENSGSLIDKQ